MTEPKVAVFDLDGTITKRDTLLPFLRSLSSLRLARGLITATPSMALSLWKREHRDKAKESMIRATFAGRPTEEIRSATDGFADQLVPDGLIPLTMERVREHQDHGHRIVIASATPAAVVVPIAERLDIDSVIATELEISNGVFTGQLVGANNRGDEKRRRVLAQLGAPPDYAYGNLPDDRPLLDVSQHAFVVEHRTVRELG